MELNLDEVVVTNNQDARQFEATVDGLHAFLTYHIFPEGIALLHTEVPRPLEGHGLATKLTRTALGFARAQRLRVVPLCPFVSAFLRKNPEYQELVSAADFQRILAPE